MIQADLQKYVEDHPELVTMRESENFHGLYVLKYKKKVFYKNLWDEYLEECRGTIVDKDFNVVSRPFTKIYNFRVESSAPVLADTEKVTSFRKINGFMCALTAHDDKLIISTTGSLDSPFVDKVKDMIDVDRYHRICLQYPAYTFLFECVHPSDPHIIREMPGMYLLGYREKTWDSNIEFDQIPHFNDFFRSIDVPMEETTVGEVMENAKTAMHEGYVFYTKDGTAAKVKTQHYLVQKLLARRKDVTTLNMNMVEEEYLPLVEAAQNAGAEFTDLEEQDRLVWCRKWLRENYAKV